MLRWSNGIIQNDTRDLPRAVVAEWNWLFESDAYMRQ